MSDDHGVLLKSVEPHAADAFKFDGTRVVMPKLSDTAGNTPRRSTLPDSAARNIASWNASSALPGSETMTRALFDGVVIAESDDVRVVEEITYFPVDDVDREHLLESPTTSRCFWKGKASYWHVQGRSDVAQNAAFTYQHPWPLARKLVTDRVAFWQGVQIVED